MPMTPMLCHGIFVERDCKGLQCVEFSWQRAQALQGEMPQQSG